MVKAINTNNAASEPAAVAITVASSGVPPNTPTVAPSPTTTPTSTPTPTPTFTATPTHTPITPAACVNDSVFVEHVTVPDGANLAAGQAFDKVWRVRNTGTCTWSSGYEFVFIGGEAMATTLAISGPPVTPGATTDLVIAMTAPTTPGTHSGQWRLRSPSTGLFGATMSVTINVLGVAQPPQQPPAQPLAGCPGAPVIASFDANPKAIAAGQKSTLSWGLVSNATSAVIDQGIGGVTTPGQMDVYPQTTTTYTLTATGCGGTVTK